MSATVTTMPGGWAVFTWDGIHIVDNGTLPGARLLAPFTERAGRAWPDEAEAERVLRDGLAFLAEFCNGGDVPPSDEPALLRSARQYVDRHYPEAGAA